MGNLYISLNVRRWEFNCEILYFIFKQTVGMGPSVCHDKIQGFFLAPPQDTNDLHICDLISYTTMQRAMTIYMNHLYIYIYICVCVLAGQFVSETKTLDFVTLCP